tara:strand:+ start:29 stop:793 length:765 start_codon:yes stop_codon:yes gene_type:complete
MTDTDTSRETLALLAQGSYKMGESNIGKKQRLENTQNHVNDTNWEVIPEHTNSEITTYRKRDDPSNIVIAHRGTKLDGKRGRTDLEADILFALGFGGHVPTFKRRKNRTNKIIKALNPTELHMTGHSLGGGSTNYTIAKSKIVKNNLTSARTYNSAAHPIFDNDIKVGKKTKKELDDKVVHHRIKHDPVSVGFKNNLPFGSLETHSVDHDSAKGKSILQNFLEITTKVGKIKRATEKGLHAHAISHFHDGSIKN